MLPPAWYQPQPEEDEWIDISKFSVNDWLVETGLDRKYSPHLFDACRVHEGRVYLRARASGALFEICGLTVDGEWRMEYEPRLVEVRPNG